MRIHHFLPLLHKAAQIRHTMGMWEKLLGVNTLLIWPATGILLTYGIGRFFLFGEWQLALVALGLFVLATVVEALLGILSN